MSDTRPTYFLLKRKNPAPVGQHKNPFIQVAALKNCDTLRTIKTRLEKRGVTGLFLHSDSCPSTRQLVGYGNV